MGDTSTIRTVWNHDEVEALVRQGWKTQDIGHCQRDVCWFMAPPEPQEPTLAEQLRVFSEEHPGHAPLHHRAADALESLTKIEAAARKYMQLWKYGATPAELDAARNVMRDVLEAQ